MATLKPRGSDGFLFGKLLIALPGMPDPRFEKSVILMFVHSDQGAMGLIVNKPLEGLTFRELVEKLDVRTSENTSDPPVLFGGPVNTGQGFVLHSAEYAAKDSTIAVTPEISLTASVEILRDMADGRGPKNSLFALGYAGWGPGQLEAELRTNGWIHCEPDRLIVFDLAHDAKWRAALAKLGADISGLSAEAGRA